MAADTGEAIAAAVTSTAADANARLPHDLRLTRPTLRVPVSSHRWRCPKARPPQCVSTRPCSDLSPGAARETYVSLLRTNVSFADGRAERGAPPRKGQGLVAGDVGLVVGVVGLPFGAVVVGVDGGAPVPTRILLGIIL